jgi:hypothetical protein
VSRAPKKAAPPSRWEEIHRSRQAVEAAKPEKRGDEDAILALTAHPAWALLIQRLKDRHIAAPLAPDTPNAGALFAFEGRRSLIRELELLSDKLRDERDGRTDDGHGRR